MKLRMLLLCLLAAVTLQAQQLMGTMAIAYGPPGKRASLYYLYEVYGKSIVDGDALLKVLKRPTPKLEYKQHKFYIGRSYAPVIKAFKSELPKKARKKADWRYGGNCDADGYNQFGLLSPQLPDKGLQTSKADMSGYTRTSSDGGGYQAPKTESTKCSRCEGKGYIIQTTSFDNTSSRAYYDSKGNLKTETVKTGSRDYTSKVRCPVCAGKGYTSQ